MESTAFTLYWLQQEKIKLEVPFFQRPYVWEEEDWQELLNSVENSPSNSMPFLGSVILQKDLPNKKYIIIDGQQRFTTLSVFIKAFIDAFVQHELPGLKAEFQKIIYDYSIHDLTPRFINRLTPSNIDKNSFELVMNPDFDINKPYLENGRIVQAYKKFYYYFKENDVSKNREVGSKILTNNKFFITIIINEDEDEQKIFDSVNSLGRDLTNTDIIKNFMFQKMKSLTNTDPKSIEVINDIHRRYWENKFYSDERRPFWDREKILGRIKTNYLESFLKDFGTIKKIYIPSETGGIDGLSKAFKQYINSINNFDALKKFVIELSDYSDCFYEYTYEYENLDFFRIDDVVNSTLLILDKTETTTFNPYVMKLLKTKPNNYLDQFISLQKFLIQRLIYKAKTKNYNKVCENLLDDGRDNIKYLKEYNANEAMGLNEFPIGLKRINNKPATLILFLIELIKRRGEENKYSDSLGYNKSLEHIMPKDWTKNWSKVSCYTEEYIKSNPFQPKNILVTNLNQVAEVRKNSINSLGNMTLLMGSLNSSLSNDTFKNKMDGNKNKSGIRKYGSSLSITQDIIDYADKNEEWNEIAITQRNIELFKVLNKFYNFF